MAQADISCEIIVSDIDENISGSAHKQVEELATRKAKAVRVNITDDAIIVAADTLVSIDGKVLSKPIDEADAFTMLKALQGRKHTVYTGVSIIKISDEGDTLRSFVDTTDVHFRPLSDDEIRGYIATGEPFDKAGAYGVQERGAVLVSRIEGDFYTVMGLPISRVCVELAKMGLNIW